MPIILAPVAEFNTQKRASTCNATSDSIRCLLSGFYKNNIDDAECALRKQKTAAVSLASDIPVRPDAKIVRRRGGSRSRLRSPILMS